MLRKYVIPVYGNEYICDSLQKDHPIFHAPSEHGFPHFIYQNKMNHISFYALNDDVGEMEYTITVQGESTPVKVSLAHLDYFPQVKNVHLEAVEKHEKNTKSHTVNIGKFKIYKGYNHLTM